MDEKIMEKLDQILTKLDEHSEILNEHSQILRALEHSAEVNRAEQDRLNNEIAHLSGNIESMRKDLSNIEIITSSNWYDIAKLKAVK